MSNGEFRVMLRTKSFQVYETVVACYRDGWELPVIDSWDTDGGRGTLLQAAAGVIEVLATAPGTEFSLVNEGPLYALEAEARGHSKPSLATDQYTLCMIVRKGKVEIGNSG